MAQGRLANAERTAGSDGTVILLVYEVSSLAFEFSGKNTMFAHLTPRYGEFFRLNGCPVSLDHYIYFCLRCKRMAIPSCVTKSVANDVATALQLYSSTALQLYSSPVSLARCVGSQAKTSFK